MVKPAMPRSFSKTRFFGMKACAANKAMNMIAVPDATTTRPVKLTDVNRSDASHTSPPKMKMRATRATN